jgi:dihydroorotase-like cyclic amidohydrolase
MQYLLPATWTAVKAAGVDLLQLAHLLSTNPAHLTGLQYKGLIAADMDADLVVRPVLVLVLELLLLENVQLHMRLN